MKAIKLLRDFHSFLAPTAYCSWLHYPPVAYINVSCGFPRHNRESLIQPRSPAFTCASKHLVEDAFFFLKMFLLYSVQRLRETAPLHLCCPSPSFPLPMCLVPAGRILPWKVRNCFLSWLGPHCRASQPAAAQPHCWVQEAACPIPAPPHQCLLNGKEREREEKGDFFQNLLPIQVPAWTSYREVSVASCCFVLWPSELVALGSASFFPCAW